MSRAGKQGQVVGLAGVGDGVGVGEGSAFIREGVDIWGVRRSDDLRILVVLLHHDDHVCRNRNGRALPRRAQSQ